MGHAEMGAWLEKYGAYTNVWFDSRIWMSNNGSVTIESYEEDYVEDIFNQVKEKLFDHINKPTEDAGFGIRK